MARSTTADELELTDEELSGLEDLDTLLSGATKFEDDVDTVASVEESPCPVCGRLYDSEPELEFHIGKRHPDYDPNASDDEDDDEEAAVPPTPDFDDDDEEEPASVQVAAPPARGKRSRRTKAEILAMKEETRRLREAEKANTKEPPEAAVQEREYLSAAMGRDDDDEVVRARREAIERLHRENPQTFGAPEPLSELEIGEGRDDPDDENILLPQALTLNVGGTLLRVRPQPWVEVKVSIAGNLPEVADFLRSLAVAAEAAGVDVASA